MNLTKVTLPPIIPFKTILVEYIKNHKMKIIYHSFYTVFSVGNYIVVMYVYVNINSLLPLSLLCSESAGKRQSGKSFGKVRPAYFGLFST